MSPTNAERRPGKGGAEVSAGSETKVNGTPSGQQFQPQVEGWSDPFRRALWFSISKNLGDKKQRHWVRKQFDGWDALIRTLQTTSSADRLQPDKYRAGGIGGRLVKGPAATPCPQMPCDDWHKTASTVVERSWVILDFDGNDPDLPIKVEKLGAPAVCHWTASATLDRQKWRVHLLTDRALTPGEYRKVAYYATQQIAPGDGGWDKASWNPFATMYFPASTVPADFRLEVIEGEPIPVDDWLLDLDRPEPPMRTRTEPADRPVVDLTVTAAEAEREAAEGLLERLLEGIRQADGNRYFTWWGEAEGSANEHVPAVMIYKFAAGGCLDRDEVDRRITVAAADWDAEVLAERISSAHRIAEADPWRPRTHTTETPEEAFSTMTEVDEDQAARDQEDPGALFDEVVATVKKYLYLPHEEDYDALVLWAATTHAIEVVQHATRLVVQAPEKECGKTRALDVLERLVRKPQATSGTTGSALTRTVAKNRPTILLDEYDTIFGKKPTDNAEDLRGIINAGHARGKPLLKTVQTSKGHKVEPFDVFAMLAMAGIGAAPETIQSRSVIIRAARRPKHVTVKPFRERRDGQRVLQPLGDRIAVWVESQIEGGAITSETEADDLGVEDRAADNWEPLLIVADAIGEVWAKRARKVAMGKTIADRNDTGPETISHRALRELREVWPKGKDKVWLPKVQSEVLVSLLRELEESPWATYGTARGGLDQNGLKYLLSGYKVRTHKARFKDKTPRAYWLDGCKKALCEHKSDKCQGPTGLLDAWASYVDEES